MSAATMMQTLWLAAQKDIDDATLQSMAGAGNVCFEMRCLAEVMEGAGILIANDSEKCGGLQGPQETSSMLLHFSATLAMLAEAVEISADATALLHERNLLRRETAAKITAIGGQKQGRTAA